MTKVRDKYTSVRFLRDCLRLTLQRPGGALSEWDLEKSDVQKLLEDCQIFLQLTTPNAEEKSQGGVG